MKTPKKDCHAKLEIYKLDEMDSVHRRGVARWLEATAEALREEKTGKYPHNFVLKLIK